MDLLRPLVIVASIGVGCILLSAGMRVVVHRQRARTAMLRSEAAAGVQFETTLNATRWYKTNGNLWGEDRSWFSLPGPTQLTVGADAFIISAPKAFSEFAFKGCDCSISVSQTPSSPFRLRDWIVISGTGTTPLGSGRQAQLAISHDNLQEIRRALVAAGAAQH
jgi:hypothetical protein